jgi:hypothetical protein
MSEDSNARQSAKALNDFHVVMNPIMKLQISLKGEKVLD